MTSPCPDRSLGLSRRLPTVAEVSRSASCQQASTEPRLEPGSHTENMGNILRTENIRAQGNEPTGRGTKRSHQDLEIDTGHDHLEEKLLNTPKRRKMTTTSDYIYETLYKSGENSDVTIHALGKEWKLHRVYLCQSGYFSSLFNRQWKESDDSDIYIDIADDNVDREALNIAFGSLYRDEIVIKPMMVIQTLAAATFLSLEGLIQQCAAVMIETVSSKTVVDYHTASVMYGQQDLTAACLGWLHRNLMVCQSLDLLREIDTDLMADVVQSPALFVMQVEMDIYSMLKKWLYLQFFPSWTGSLKDLINESEAYFRLQGKSGSEFLDTEPGRSYTGPFRALRLCHVINDMPSTRIIEADRIIPKAWLLPVYRRQWLHMLRVEQGHDKGPEKRSSKLEKRFLTTSLRCGRVLQKDGQYCWRWTGYNFGVDLLISFTSRLILIKRNTLSQSFPGATSMQAKRHIMYCMKVCSMDKLGHVVYEKSTDLKQLSLGKDQEQVVMGIDRKADFPLHISCCFMSYIPRGGNHSNTTADVVSSPDNSSSDDSASEDLGNLDNVPAAGLGNHGNQDLIVEEGDVVHLDLDDNGPYF